MDFKHNYTTSMNIDFKKGDGLVPAIIQDWISGKVLMLGFMNEDALRKTETEKKVTFYSRTKNHLWTKGETSGNFLIVKEIIADCDNDTLLIKAEPKGPTCHTGADTCFNESNVSNALFLHYLQEIIKSRKESTADKSYTKSLFDKGINKIAQKVGEEAVELVIEAKDSDMELFRNEAADLLFHLLVLLEAKGVQLEEVVDVLVKRHK
jgi:phosphoribosyl-ATP pyrophosphohydrolase/phosphoribosyl-AMP cyclohydrolase